jgi:hypothetical protein
MCMVRDWKSKAFPMDNIICPLYIKVIYVVKPYLSFCFGRHHYFRLGCYLVV